MSTIAEGIRVGQAASSQAISQKQIGMILALITTIATAVAGCLMVIYGGLTDDLREDHAAVISRMEEGHSERVNDLKAHTLRMSESLETCLDRE